MKKIDLRGMECPTPLIKAIEEYTKLGEGETLEILMDSKQCVELLDEGINEMKAGEIKIEETNPGTYKVILTKKSKAAKVKFPSADSC